LEWDQTLGKWDARAPFTTFWGGLEPNFVGLDEFAQLCRLVGAEPLICVRWTGKQPADAAAEVEYMNGGAETRWGSLRARNGHAEPYGVKYWQIGNEVGGQDYERTIAAFARAMRATDPSIKLMSSYPRTGVLASGEGQLDYLCPHHYEMGDLTEAVRDFESLRERIRTQGQGREVRVAVTEWNTTGGDFGLKRGILQSLGNALDCSRYHNVLQRYADLVEMGIRSNLVDSFGSGAIVTGPGWMYLAPTYYAEELYGHAAGSYPLHVDRAGDLPWQLQQPDVSAALSADGRMLRIYAVNSTAAPLSPTIALTDGGQSAAGATVFVLKNRQGLPNTEAMNSASDREAVSVETRAVAAAGRRVRFTFEPYSLTLLEIRLAGR
jgi:alpha-N-arabinofuranosidase